MATKTILVKIIRFKITSFLLSIQSYDNLLRDGYQATVSIKKVWSRFVYLKRGSDKTQKQVNRYNPHTCIVECRVHANEYR